MPLSGAAEQTRRLLLWAAEDPHAAAAWAGEIEDPAARQEALMAVCFELAEKDPVAAVALAESLGLEDGPGVVENLVARWASLDPFAALDWVERRPAGEPRDALRARLAFDLAASHPEEAVRLVEELPPGPRREEAAASVVHQWWLRDPAASARWVEGLPPGPLRQRALRELRALRKGTSPPTAPPG